MSTPEWTSEKEARLAAANDTLLAEALAHIDRLTAESVQERKHTNSYIKRLHAAEAKLEHFEKDIHAADVAALKDAEAKLAEAQKQIGELAERSTRDVLFWRGQCEDRERWLRERDSELAAARAAIAAWRHSPSLPDCLACSVFGAHPGSALRSTPEEPKPEHDPVGMGWIRCRHGQWMPPGACTPEEPKSCPHGVAGGKGCAECMGTRPDR